MAMGVVASAGVVVVVVGTSGVVVVVVGTASGFVVEVVAARGSVSVSNVCVVGKPSTGSTVMASTMVSPKLQGRHELLHKADCLETRYSRVSSRDGLGERRRRKECSAEEKCTELVVHSPWHGVGGEGAGERAKNGRDGRWER